MPSSASYRVLGGLFSILIATPLCNAVYADDAVISQRDKRFQPGSVMIAKRQALAIVNDDGKTVHHAYVESEAFNFDSGDQAPGSRTTIVFPAAGDFKVLCGIHPNMTLDVHVH